MGRILNGKNRSPVLNGMSPILLAEVVRTLEQAKVAFDAIDGDFDPATHSRGEEAKALMERTRLMIDSLIPKLTR